MFDFLLKLTHGKRCQKMQHQKPKEENTQCNNERKPSGEIVVDIDYDKLADSIVEANNKILRQKEKNEIIEYEQRKENWKKALLGNEYKGDIENASNWQIFWALMSFKKENATGDNAIFALFQLVNSCLLWIYEIVFYGIMVLGLIFGYYVCKDIISNWSNVTTYLQACGDAILKFFLAIATIIFPLIIARIIRVARLQVNNIKDKQFALNIFNALIIFTALIIAIITMFLTRGG